MRASALWAVLLFSTPGIKGQIQFDFFYIDTVVNAASHAPAGLYSSAVAPGSLMEIGGFFNPAKAAKSPFPLTAEFGGISIQIEVGGQKVNALIYAVASGLVTAVVPSATPEGDGVVRLKLIDRVSNDIPVKIARSGFGIFTRNEVGTGPAIVQSGFDGFTIPPPLNSIIHSARPGESVVMWGTGLGRVEGDESAGPLPGKMELDAKVLVGGAPAELLYLGRSGCCAGIDEIQFRIPDGVSGCRVPVVVKVGDTLSNFATMSIDAEGLACRKLPGMNQEALDELSRGGEIRFGQLNFTRLDVRTEYLGKTVDMPFELLLGDFVRFRHEDLLATQSMESNVMAGAPSAGGCLVLPADEEYFGLLVPVIQDPTTSRWGAPRLHAGEKFDISGPGGKSQVSRVNNMYWNLIGGYDPYDVKMLPLLLAPGEITLTNGEGGKDVGAFEAKMVLPKAVTWKNRDDIKDVKRDQDLTVTWEGEEPDKQQVVLYAWSDSGVRNTTPTGLLCTAPASQGELTVPAWILKALPPSGMSGGLPMGALGLATIPTAAASGKFAATGLHAGNLQYTFVNMKLTAIQ